MVDEKALEKMYSYVERNYGKTFLTEAEEKRMNYLMCRGIHSDCSLYFTRGILKDPVLRNYQYEYARKQKDKNLYEYYDNHRIVKNNIRILTDMLRKTLIMRDETEEVLADRGKIVPSRLWRVGRTSEARFFYQRVISGFQPVCGGYSPGRQWFSAQQTGTGGNPGVYFK